MVRIGVAYENTFDERPVPDAVGGQHLDQVIVINAITGIDEHDLSGRYQGEDAPPAGHLETVKLRIAVHLQMLHIGIEALSCRGPDGLAGLEDAIEHQLRVLSLIMQLLHDVVYVREQSQ